VIGHENPGKQPGPTGGYILRKSPEKLLPVFGVPKNGGSLNSPGHYMVEQIGEIQPGSSGHGGILVYFHQHIKITFISYQRPLFFDDPDFGVAPTPISFSLLIVEEVFGSQKAELVQGGLP
jgi:hypothetical protein